MATIRIGTGVGKARLLISTQFPPPAICSRARMCRGLFGSSGMAPRLTDSGHRTRTASSRDQMHRSTACLYLAPEVSEGCRAAVAFGASVTSLKWHNRGHSSTR